MRDVMTVRGPVPAEALGLVLPHEHLLCDLRSRWHPPPADRPDLWPLVDADPAPPTAAPWPPTPTSAAPTCCWTTRS